MCYERRQQLPIRNTVRAECANRVLWRALLCWRFLFHWPLFSPPDASVCSSSWGTGGDCTVCTCTFTALLLQGRSVLGLGGGLYLTKGVGRRASLSAVSRASPCLPAGARERVRKIGNRWAT